MTRSEHADGQSTTELCATRQPAVWDHLGFGFQGDLGLELELSRANGLDDAGKKLARDRILAMRPKLVRLHVKLADFRPSAAGPNDYGSEAFRDTVSELELYQEAGAEVLLSDWAPCPEWTDNLYQNPHPRHHTAIASAWGDMLVHLRRERGLSCVRWAMLYNEPSHMQVLADGYESLTRKLRQALRERDLLDEVGVMGPDVTHMSDRGFFEHATWAHGEVFDAFDVHVYDVDTGVGVADALRPYLERVATLDGYIAGAPHNDVFDGLIDRACKEGWRDFGPQGRRPLLLTEFGYGNVHAYICSQNDTFEYGLFLADVAIRTSQAGVGAALMWTVMDGYMYGVAKYRGTPVYMRWGLWRWADAHWEPRPGFHAWSLVTRYVERHSRVYRVGGVDASVGASVFEAPDGRWTVLLVNRGEDRRLKLTGLPPGRSFRTHVYAESKVLPTDGSPSSGDTTLSSDSSGKLDCPVSARTFVCLEERQVLARTVSFPIIPASTRIAVPPALPHPCSPPVVPLPRTQTRMAADDRRRPSRPQARKHSLHTPKQDEVLPEDG